MTVSPPKSFPGMAESTFLSRSFADQGVKLRIRKEPRALMYVETFPTLLWYTERRVSCITDSQLGNDPFHDLKISPNPWLLVHQIARPCKCREQRLDIQLQVEIIRIMDQDLRNVSVLQSTLATGASMMPKGEYARCRMPTRRQQPCTPIRQGRTKLR